MDRTMDELLTGRMARRAQSKITERLDDGIEEVAAAMAGDGDPRMMRSVAIRDLLARGLRSWWREQARNG